jgi:geranylgeranyl diphosphate synthase, type II
VIESIRNRTEKHSFMHDLTYYKDFISEEIRNLKYRKTPPELYEPVSYIMKNGGKRIRPIMTLMACELFEGDIRKALWPAIGMEMFHNFTLMHDDIMDKATLRRGIPTVHHKWNENAAILSGDVMLILANQLMLKTDDDVLREVMNLYNTSGLLVCEGQQYDLNYENREEISLDDYLQMIELKTASLLSSCFRLGAVIAKSSEENKNKIESFGLNLGISFQIEDDILDVYSKSKKFGKSIGGDILSNKKTYLLVKAMEIANKSILEEIQYWLRLKSPDPKEKIQVFLKIYNDLNVQELAMEDSKKYYAISLEYLKQIDIHEHRKEELYKLAAYLINRKY